MKTIVTLIGLIVPLLPLVVVALPSPVTAKTNVTGIVIDFEKHDCVLILKDYKGWDRKQAEVSPGLVRAATRKWIKSFDQNHAAIIIKKDDLKNIRKGKRVTIEGYSYFYDERQIFPSYDKLTISK